MFDEQMKMKQSHIDALSNDVGVLKKEKDEMSQSVSLLQKQKQLVQNELAKMETICKQYEQENNQLLRKIGFIEKCGTFKGSDIHIQPPKERMSTTSNYLNSANIHQEDEVGEVFDNNFLSDLKNEHGSQHSLESTYSAAELQKRNSMYPQQLRSTYSLCNVDFPLSEQELKVSKRFYAIIKPQLIIIFMVLIF